LSSTDSQSTADLQAGIIAELGVTSDFDAAREIERRVAFLADYLVKTRRKGYVLGISGGVDSLVAGHLSQKAVERVRQSGGEATFQAMRLPYGVQHDESAAQKSLESIRADKVHVVDIRPAADALLASVRPSIDFRDASHEDFVMGNIKARQRMIAQYAVAGACDALVVGTDQAAEALMGFFTKHGDGAADIIPLSGLSKRRVRELARALGAPEELVMKVPTADLESLVPGKPDEDAFGVSYEMIDDFLEGKSVPEDAAEKIKQQWFATMHKRALPLAPHDVGA
jgi:NAD+ synthase